MAAGAKAAAMLGSISLSTIADLKGAKMRFKFIAAVSTVALLVACASKPSDSGAAANGGSTGTSSTASIAEITPLPGSADDFVQNVGDRVFFGFDRYDLNTEARAQLEKQANWLKAYPQYSIVIEGHCDDRGTREYNLALGERRAEAVKNYLISLGVRSTEMQAVSFGKERPAMLGYSEQAWAANRRGVIVLE